MRKNLIFVYLLIYPLIIAGQDNVELIEDFSLCEGQDSLLEIPDEYSQYDAMWTLPNTGEVLYQSSYMISSSTTTSGSYEITIFLADDTITDNFSVNIDSISPVFNIFFDDVEVNLDSICIEDNPFIWTGTNYIDNIHYWIINGDTLPDFSDNQLFINTILDDINYNEIYEYNVAIENSCDNGPFEAEKSISFYINECYCLLEMPNIFTPNGDLENSVFIPINNHESALEPVNLCESTNFSMEIFNQWGKHISTIQSNDDFPSWDGLNKSGKEVSEGVYFYRIVYQINAYTDPQEKEITGFVHLYR